MSCIWQENQPGQWSASPLAVGRLLQGEDLGIAGIALLALRQGGSALLVRPGVWARVNGEPVLGGLRLLEHKDEILAGAARLCFSQETTPVVVHFHAVTGQRLPICPVCRGPVREDNQAVACPGCGRWFHQLDADGDRPAKPCWTYAPTCRFCNHPTAFAASAAWRPDREDELDRR
jgi:hypothetical protein